MKVLVAYYSRTGNTKKMAQAIAQGVKEQGLTVHLKSVDTVKPKDLLNYSALIFGSPTYYGLMAAPLKNLFDQSVKYHGKLAGKIGGVFTSCGGASCGAETTLFSIIDALLIHGMLIIGQHRMFHYGPVSVGAPNKYVLKHCISYGQKIADITAKMFAP